MKKLISLFLILTAAVMCFSCTQDNAENNDTDTDTDTADTAVQDTVPNVIDIYLIAGQSNAVGCTKIESVDAILEYAPELKDGGFSNVHYAGSSRTGGDPFVNNEKEWQGTNIGFGMTEEYIGPEVGLAKALCEYYNAETGRHAGIIKFAHGGSSIRDISTGENATGNWVSPSYAESLGVSYADDAITGGFYRGFLAQVKKNIAQIEAYSGHTEINIVGLYWMQGETDRNASVGDEYDRSFTFLVSDLRRDVAEIMLEFTGGESDCGASDMPIVIGTISRTFALSSGSTETKVNVPFIERQMRLADTIDNCYILDNSNYPISKWNAETGEREAVGSDIYHWNQADMLEIGSNLGKLFLDEIVKADVE